MAGPVMCAGITMYDPLKAFKAQPGRDATRVVEVKRLGIGQVQHVLIAVLCLEYVFVHSCLFMILFVYSCIYCFLFIQNVCSLFDIDIYIYIL